MYSPQAAVYGNEAKMKYEVLSGALISPGLST